MCVCVCVCVSARERSIPIACISPAFKVIYFTFRGGLVKYQGCLDVAFCHGTLLMFIKISIHLHCRRFPPSIEISLALNFDPGGLEASLEHGTAILTGL